MSIEFMNDFSERMKNLIPHSVIIKRALNKTSLSDKYGFNSDSEIVELIYGTLLFIMECSLTEEDCTTDDIARFILQINEVNFKKNLTLDNAKEISKMIVDEILTNKSNDEDIELYNYMSSKYENFTISLINQKVIYVDEVRRTSHFLTQQGYKMMFSLREIEQNMMIPIQELIFKENLRKKDYSKALKDVKEIFDLSRMQLRIMESSIIQIKENVLNYSVKDYIKIVDENIEVIEKQKNNFKKYVEEIKEREELLKEQEMKLNGLSEQEQDNLEKLREIKRELNRIIDEHQILISKHLEFDAVYQEQLKNTMSIRTVERIDTITELYEPIKADSSKLTIIEAMLKQLLISNNKSIFNLEKILEPQRVIRKRKIEEEEVEINFDKEEVEERIKEEALQKEIRYRNILIQLLEYIIFAPNYEIDLETIIAKMTQIEKENLIPDPHMFAEVISELLQVKTLDFEKIKKRKPDNSISIGQFELTKTIVEILENNKKFRAIRNLSISKSAKNNKVRITNVKLDNGTYKDIICNNIDFKLSLNL